MEKFQLALFLKIVGIGSASGIVFHDSSLFIISDNSSYLYEYKTASDTLTKIALTENPQENIAKKIKPDFESITQKGNKLLILGSGSTENRTILKTYHLKSNKIKSKDFSPLFEKLKSEASISDDDLNIEGLLLHHKNYFFFQRGNSANASNGVFCVSKNDKKVVFHAVTLPKINAIEATFTDAILVDDSIYFLAAVENTASTYDDGEILGTFLGKMNSTDFSIEKTLLISETNKFEGIALYKKTESQLEFLLCEDNDTEILESNIYKLTLKH